MTDMFMFDYRIPLLFTILLVGFVAAHYWGREQSRRRGRKLRSFPGCYYLGGDPREYDEAELIVIGIYESCVVLDVPWAIRTRAWEIPRSRIREARRLERPPPAGVEGVNYVEDTERHIDFPVRLGLTWVWVLLSWDGGKGLFVFSTPGDAEEFAELVLQGCDPVGQPGHHAERSTGDGV